MPYPVASAVEYPVPTSQQIMISKIKLKQQ